MILVFKIVRLCQMDKQLFENLLTHVLGVMGIMKAHIANTVNHIPVFFDEICKQFLAVFHSALPCPPL